MTKLTATTIARDIVKLDREARAMTGAIQRFAERQPNVHSANIGQVYSLCEALIEDAIYDVFRVHGVTVSDNDGNVKI